MELNLALTIRAEKLNRWSGAKFYTQMDKLGGLLANKLTPRMRLSTLPRIRTQGQTTTSDPTKILTAFRDFYNNLYNAG